MTNKEKKQLWWSQLIFKKGRAKKITADHSQGYPAVENLLRSLTIADGKDGGIPAAGRPDPLCSGYCPEESTPTSASDLGGDQRW